MTPTLAAKVGGGAAAITGVAAGGTFLATKETIKRELHEYLLPTSDDFNKEWDLKVTKLSTATETKEGLEVVKNSQNKRDELKKWCEDKSSEIYSSAFNKEKTELKDLVKEWCVYTIEEKITETKRNLNVTDNTNESEFKRLVKELKKNKEDSKLTQALKDIAKEGEATSDLNWSKLKDWCKETYSKGYQGENDNWYLIDNYCSKATILSELKEIILPVDEAINTDWNKKVTDASNDSSGVKDTTFRTTIKTGEEAAKRQKLQAWCQSQYPKANDVKAPSDNGTNLKEEVKKWCTLTIGDKLENELTASDTSKDNDWKAQVKELKKYKKSTTEANKISFTKELEDIVSKNSTETSDVGWENLKKWCGESYSKGYKGTNKQLYKLTEKFCKKSS